MAYRINGNDSESCRALCENFYNAMFDEEGHINTFNSNESGELTGEYLGAKKEDFYYYRGYAIQENSSSAVNDFSIYGSNHRMPFHTNDNIVRPFFTLKLNNHSDGSQSWTLSFYYGCKKQSSNPDWYFNTKRYGDANRDYDPNLFERSDNIIVNAYQNAMNNGKK